MLKCYYPGVRPNSIVIVEQMCFLLPLCFVTSFRVLFPSHPSLYFFVQTDLSLWFTCGPLLLNPRSSGINNLQGSFLCLVFFQVLFFPLSGKLPDSCLFCCTHMDPINSQIPAKHRGDTTVGQVSRKPDQINAGTPGSEAADRLTIPVLPSPPHFLPSRLANCS